MACWIKDVPRTPLICSASWSNSDSVAACLGLTASSIQIISDPLTSISFTPHSAYSAGVGESLVEAAQNLQATLMVLGTRGMGSIKR